MRYVQTDDSTKCKRFHYDPRNFHFKGDTQTKTSLTIVNNKRAFVSAILLLPCRIPQQSFGPLLQTSYYHGGRLLGLFLPTTSHN